MAKVKFVQIAAFLPLFFLSGCSVDKALTPPPCTEWRTIISEEVHYSSGVFGGKAWSEYLYDDGSKYVDDRDSLNVGDKTCISRSKIESPNQD